MIFLFKELLSRVLLLRIFTELSILSPDLERKEVQTLSGLIDIERRQPQHHLWDTEYRKHFDTYQYKIDQLTFHLQKS